MLDIGAKYNNWTVLKEDDNNINYKPSNKRYICKCVCGTEKSVLERSIKYGKSKSCGCTKPNALKNYDGCTFGKLTVIESISNYNGTKRTSYRCRCECGNEIIVSNSSLHKIKSCGCSRFDKANDTVGKKYGFLSIKEVGMDNGVVMAKCQCDCGNQTYARLDQIKSGNTKSCGCLKSPDLTNRVFGRLTVIKEVESDIKQKKWLCKCECGYETILTSYLLLSGHTKSCGCLRSERLSSWELFIAQKLNALNIVYEKEKIFDDCRNNKPLRFDFYIPSLNTCIEYDGEQHFVPIEHFGGLKAFEIRIKNDNIKTKYCEDNNITLIRISSKSETEVEQILLNLIQNPVTTTVA